MDVESHGKRKDGDRLIASVVEMIGIRIILAGIVYSLIRFIICIKKPDQFAYVALRQSLGKSILLGLEVLIAAGIMATIRNGANFKVSHDSWRNSPYPNSTSPIFTGRIGRWISLAKIQIR